MSNPSKAVDVVKDHLNLVYYVTTNLVNLRSGSGIETYGKLYHFPRVQFFLELMHHMAVYSIDYSRL